MSSLQNPTFETKLKLIMILNLLFIHFKIKKIKKTIKKNVKRLKTEKKINIIYLKFAS